MNASRVDGPAAGRVGWTLLGVFLALAAAGAARAGGGPENIFLVVNANGPSSMEVANYYIDL